MPEKSSTIAVITTGGKQYIVSEGTKLKVEKLPTEAGEKIVFDEVLLTANDTTTTVGTPVVAKAAVEAKVVGHGRRDKLFGVKFKAKKRYRRVFGHRQSFTEIEISKIKG